MQINVIYDQALSSLPPGFVAAVQYVVNYFDTIFTNNVTVTIHVGYGEIAGQPLGPGALGESETFLDSFSYSQVLAALQANDPSSAQQAAYATLPTTSPLSGGTLWLATAEAKALGLVPAKSGVDGYVGFSNTYPFSYSPTASPAANQFYFVGVVEHEISEVLGRDSWLGAAIGGTNSYGVMDLFRYSAPGVRDLTAQPPSSYSSAYFSIDNGTTNLDNWNTNPNGDLGDWANTAGADAFLAFSNPGQINKVTQNDLTLMNILGWDPAVSGGTSKGHRRRPGVSAVTSGFEVVSSTANEIGAFVGAEGSILLLEVVSGGMASATSISSGGLEIVSFGGSDYGALISGGIQYDYGSASGDTIFAGGVEIVESGGIASGSIIAGGILEVASGGLVGSAPVVFTGAGGVLELDASQNFQGLIGGFTSSSGVNAEIDLRDIAFTSNMQAQFSENATGTSGTLTVTNGSQTASLTLLGQFSTTNFTLASDATGGTIVTDPQVVGSATSPVAVQP